MTDRERIEQAIDYIRRNDCDFLTAETVSMYAHTNEDTTRRVMLDDLSMDPRLVG
jgi:hypothetical protein